MTGILGSLVPNIIVFLVTLNHIRIKILQCSKVDLGLHSNALDVGVSSI